ncbi:TRADD-N-associated membrane domain-containing protein [Streptomyces mirabilis]|uniref:TRADD-N-associated membrane domain-containing protein n=1 Tax=Streptomyces mirabilis TaxID=68239 RepID=UPI0033B2D0DE
MLAEAILPGVAFEWISSKLVDRERKRLSHQLLDDSVDDNGRRRSDVVFTKLMIEYYAHGLTQARLSFGASLVASTVGGVVLLVGVAFAIFQRGADSDHYASIVPTVAGILTTAIGTLFNRQADKALRHMEGQSKTLRQDMKQERDNEEAIRLLAEIPDLQTRAHLQAALILKFSSAVLPPADGLLRCDPTEPVPQRAEERPAGDPSKPDA